MTDRLQEELDFVIGLANERAATCKQYHKVFMFFADKDNWRIENGVPYMEDGPKKAVELFFGGNE
ncbi:hypothetical protein [Fictibacillus gelatini]|uniref:hypothetical protein n=1 Tax=Fictibacillus gelatini TaxID=225985 RepID=UPI0004041820|nr:hypothetical protein [Fictibacillus gelatini]